MFHELRVPINAMFLAIDILNENQREVDKSHRKQRRTRHTIDNTTGSDTGGGAAIHGSSVKGQTVGSENGNSNDDSNNNGPSHSNGNGSGGGKGDDGMGVGSGGQKHHAHTVSSSSVNHSSYMLEIMQSQCKSIQSILNESLDLQRLESNKLSLEFSSFSLRDLALQVQASHNVSAMKKAAQVVARVSPHLPHRVFGDMQRIRQVLSNFVSNGVKFCDPNTQILIEVDVETRAEHRQKDASLQQTLREVSIDVDGVASSSGDRGKSNKTVLVNVSAPDAPKVKSSSNANMEVDANNKHAGQSGNDEKDDDLCRAASVEGSGYVYVKVCVSNTGVGIKKRDMKDLFTPFKQIRAGELQNGGGSGMHVCMCA